MPQLVALFNGVGGGAAALVALLELGSVAGWGLSSALSSRCAFTVSLPRCGGLSFTGSVGDHLRSSCRS